jgi:arylsulfatase A-like enzyme
VPFVIAGPGVPVRRVDVNVSLADVTPTVLGRLDLPISEQARERIEGRDLLGDPPAADALRYFGCWQEFRCRGFVLGNHKVVVLPERGAGFYFDLADDPQEQEPRLLTEAHLSRLPELNARFAEHYPRNWPMELLDVPYARWICPPGRACRHVDPPSAPADAPEEP